MRFDGTEERELEVKIRVGRGAEPVWLREGSSGDLADKYSQRWSKAKDTLGCGSSLFPLRSAAQKEQESTNWQNEAVAAQAGANAASPHPIRSLSQCGVGPARPPHDVGASKG